MELQPNDEDDTADQIEQEEIIAILDAGSQFGKLIDRKVRELSVRSEILPLNTSLAELRERRIKGIIISGGPGSVYDKGSALSYDKNLFNQDSNIGMYIIEH